MDSLIYAGKYKYEKVLKESIKVLITKTDLKDVLDSFVKIISKHLSVNKVSLFLEDDTSGDYKLKASYGLLPGGEFNLRENSDTISWLKKHKKPFVRDELERQLSDDSFRNVYNGLFKIKAELVIPVFFRAKLEGLLILDYKNSKDIYTDKDMDILQSVASEAAIAIENAKLYERIIIDTVSGAYNYNYMKERLLEELDKTERTHYPFTLMAVCLKYLDSSFMMPSILFLSPNYYRQKNSSLMLSGRIQNFILCAGHSTCSLSCACATQCLALWAMLLLKNG
jgi:transcriptional regulator with GAF, ATPase, and Fis domain